MRRRQLLIATLLACLAAVIPAATSGGAPPPRAPASFFGIGPQSGLFPEDVRYMKAGGIGSIRLPLAWAAIQPTPNGPYDWSSYDAVIEIAARAGLEVLPAVGSPPKWVARKLTTMPVDSAKQRNAWSAFLRAAVARYGPGGQFWQERRTEGVNYQPAIPIPKPIKTWQIWNESNFFYFAFPVSSARYAKLVTISSKAIKSVRPGAKVLLSGLFGEPTAGGNRGMPAAEFLDQLYKRGIASRFDGVALHPYAVDAETLEEMTEEFHEVSVEHGDRPSLYITEIGWGSESNFKQVAFEQGPRGQVKQLKDSYAYLLENRGRLNLKGVYWFSWKDLKDSCTFCDSVGFFREGPRFKPKPAWHAFVRLTGGRARP